MGLRYEVRDGRWQFFCPEHRIQFENLRPLVRYSLDGNPLWFRPALLREGNRFVSLPNDHGLALQFEVEQTQGFLIIRGDLGHRGTAPLRIDEVAPLWLPDSGRVSIGGDAGQWQIFRNGYQSWTGTRSFAAQEVDPGLCFRILQLSLMDVKHLPRQRPGEFRSELFTAIQHRVTGDALVAGFLDGRFAFAAIEIAVHEGRCTDWLATVDYDEIPLLPGQHLTLPPLALSCGNNAYAGLSAYAELSGAWMKARVPVEKPTGWCSWYYYFTNIDEGAVLENLDSVKHLSGILHLDYFQIDDGYQADIGDWLDANTKFPHGMAEVAQRIRQAGFRPGLWIAPFLARTTSQLVVQHPDWLVRNEEGRPQLALINPLWGWRACYALDTTHPEVLEWIEQMAGTVTQQWGYDLLKLDFLYAGALPGRRYDSSATRAQALRKGLEAIRKAASDAFLIGCGSPLGPAVGIVDAMRIGPDVAPYWSDTLSRTLLRDLHGVATKHAIRNTLARSFLHRRWWLNDPDCLMVRKSGTRLGEEEFRSLATAIALTDGLLVVSDRLSLLNPVELERLRQTMELATSGPPRFVNIMSGDFPDVVVHCSPDQCAVAVFNPLDQSAKKRLPLAQLLPHARTLTHVPEFWTGTIFPVHDGVVELGELPPHSVRVLTIPPI